MRWRKANFTSRNVPVKSPHSEIDSPVLFCVFAQQYILLTTRCEPPESYAFQLRQSATLLLLLARMNRRLKSELT